MQRPLIYNIFIMNTPSHIVHGTWRAPESRGPEYNSLRLWIDLAQLAERGKLDGIFIADVFGLYSAFGGSWKVLVENSIQFPISDPAMLISAMAAATRNLGFVYTNSVLQQHPFTFARAISTLDHLTEGRVGWNIVTSASENGSRSMGLDSITDHDERYRWADEYTEVTYKLWEGSWDDGAVIADRIRGVYADPNKVRKINHLGPRYRVEGPHLVEPSPQRTPVLFQAGSSGAGLAFAARNAEGAFLVSGTPESAGAKVKELRSLARAQGRLEEDLLCIEGASFVVGETEEAALRKEAELEDWISEEAEMLQASGASGMDLADVNPDTPLSELAEKVPGMRGGIRLVMDSTPSGTIPTVRDLLRSSSRRYRITGTPEQIADRIAEYARVGINGFNIIHSILPETYIDFVDQVAPVLKQRGLMQREYASGTLREKLFPGSGPHINERHPSQIYKGGKNLD